MATHDEKNMPFIKNLASSDRKTRTQALATLRTFLAASTATRQLTALDHLKVWKGLFYALWMADRPVPQQNLCDELAGLLDVFSNDDAAVVAFLAAFWETLSREWAGIDVLRLEKFLLLVRRVLAASLAWARAPATSTSTDAQAAAARRARLLALFRDWPLEQTGDLAKVAVGLRLHVLDIWVDEAARVGLLPPPADDDDEEDYENAEAAEAAMSEADREFLAGLRPVVEHQLKSPSKPVRARAKESLADDRLPWNKGKKAAEKADGEDEDGWGGGWGGFTD